MAEKQRLKDRAIKKNRARKILKILRKTYGQVECALYHNNPFQLSVATILSAQCTDKQVNRVTPPLFKKFATPKDFAEAPITEIEMAIKSTGFYKNKSRLIQGFARAILERHNGKVPHTLETLIELPGFGRKTANVILGVAYGVPGIVVDTHVKRLTFRMGITRQQDPTKIELEMMTLLPKKDWSDFGLLLIQHGRMTCMARRPMCDECPVDLLCPKKGVGEFKNRE